LENFFVVLPGEVVAGVGEEEEEGMARGVASEPGEEDGAEKFGQVFPVGYLGG
jgi:hypothetical protein